MLLSNLLLGKVNLESLFSSQLFHLWMKPCIATVTFLNVETDINVCVNPQRTAGTDLVHAVVMMQ